jgi:hypothetical protein
MTNTNCLFNKRYPLDTKYYNDLVNLTIDHMGIGLVMLK